MDAQAGEATGEDRDPAVAGRRSATEWRDYYQGSAAEFSEFSLRTHLLKVAAAAGAIAVVGLVLAVHARWQDWLIAPLFWVIGNFVEWGFHRFPMHRPMTPRVMYRNHSFVHHRSFQVGAMEIRDVQDLGLVMMPWYTLVAVFLAASPVAGVAWLLVGKGAAGVFFLAALAYFVAYELTHTLDHLPRELSRRIGLESVGLFRSVRANHAHHHDLREMADHNFNVTLPLADRVMGTYTFPSPAAHRADR